MIFKIFKKDLKGLSRNILALAIALGLCLIPSLYAWFNIYSNWDPYANTASVQIAIVSEDEGYSESDDSTINMGEQIVEQLHSNDKLGWRFPETKDEAMASIDSLIQIVKSPELRLYDKMRWGEDPLESLDGDKSHVSYLSHLAWMIGNYRRIGGDDRYNGLHESICNAMNRRILQSPILNIPTYPGEPVYVPDMMVAIVALADYAVLNDGKYSSTVKKWLHRAKSEWCDERTGLLLSFLDDDGKTNAPVKGSYSALNCYYLTKIDGEFAQEQYERLKENFSQNFPASGIKEYHDRSCWLGMDIDAGPIILNLSPSGTAFAIGSATYFGDKAFRNGLLKTAEIAGHTIQLGNKRHYLLADLALVGEAITLAMRTNHRTTRNARAVIKCE